MTQKIRLYCTTNEDFPLKLVDVVDLFFRELKARGVEQEWYSRNRTPGPLRRDIIAGVPVIVPPWTPRFGAIGKLISVLLYWLLDAAMLMRFLWRPVDVIQVRDKYFAAVIGLLVARLRGRVFTVWLSYPFPEHSFEQADIEHGLRRFHSRLNGHIGTMLLYRTAMRFADHCFVQSEQMKLDLHEFYGLPLSSMTAVPMGVAESVRDVEPHLNRPVEHGPNDVQTVIYVGTLHRVRRLEVMMDAFIAVARARPNVRFQIVGDGTDPSDRERLESLVVAAGMSSRFEFTGFIPIAKAWESIAMADVCVSPFYTNRVLRVASPTKLVEYLAFGKPTVANDHPEHSRVLRDSGGGVCVPWSVEGFADGILQCLDDPVTARQMGEKGRAWVLANRTYGRLADQVLAVYERLIAEKH